MCVRRGGRQAKGQLRWEIRPSKCSYGCAWLPLLLLTTRGLAFFSSQEVFVAEWEIAHEEWSLIKLVFTFLPYEPRLSESWFLITQWSMRSQPGVTRIVTRPLLS